MDINDKIYDEKSLSNLFSEIHKNTENKRNQINTYIAKLVKLINTPDDAVVIGPIIQSLMETNVKNDEHLIRIAQIVQRLMNTSGNKGDDLNSLLTEEEKQDLLKNMNVELAEMQTDAKEKVDEPDIFNKG